MDTPYGSVPADTALGPRTVRSDTLLIDVVSRACETLAYKSRQKYDR